jgi:hypothetical protein
VDYEISVRCYYLNNEGDARLTFQKPAMLHFSSLNAGITIADTNAIGSDDAIQTHHASLIGKRSRCVPVEASSFLPRTGAGPNISATALNVLVCHGP